MWEEGLEIETQCYTATSLAGFIATEENSLEWLFPLRAVWATGYPEFLSGVGAPGSISIKCQVGEVARCRPETWF